MIKLLIVVPYPELYEKIRSAIDNYPREEVSADIRVLTVVQTTTLDITGYDAIIARGYSALRLKQLYPQIPLIAIPMSPYDVIRSIGECRSRYGAGRIAITGAFGMLYELEALEQLLNCELKLFPAETHEEAEEVVKGLKDAGYEAVIGGYTVKLFAEKYGIPFSQIKTGEEAVMRALNEAVSMVQEVNKDRLTAETYKTVIYSSKNGILYVSPDGVIQVRNHVARAMNNERRLLHRPLKDTFPAFYKTFCEVMKSGQEADGIMHVFAESGIAVSATFTPVLVNDVVSGIVITMMDITDIQRLETQIRKRLSEKGLKAKYTFDDIIHQSSVIEETIRIAKKYAQLDSNILIVGETGTGKELIAQSIHNASRRKNGPFVAINCAALPENLLESELFGYVEGAFTGTARGGKMGLFEQAHGGTLFLDEIGEISQQTQVRLLRVLQEKEVRRIGDNKVIMVDVRIIAATNRSIPTMVANGEFRNDLAYRLDVLRLFVPPLRAREHDVELLFVHLLDRKRKEENRPAPCISRDALSVLRGYPFKGNIRELINVVERADVISEGNEITRQSLLSALYPQDVGNETGRDARPQGDMIPQGPGALPAAGRSGTAEEEMIRLALDRCAGSRSKAAALLGMDRTTLWRKMKRLGIT